jgi:hypothetical protein
MKSTKTQSELYYEIISAEQYLGQVKLTCAVVNHYVNAGSLGTLEYSINGGTSWLDATLVTGQDALNSISLTGKRRNVVIYWDASADLYVVDSYSNVLLRVSFYDRANQAGTQSEIKSTTITSIDYRPIETPVLLRPYPEEKDFNLEFKTLIAWQPCLLHFQITVSENADYSAPVFTANSATSQVGWTWNGAAFPAWGADSAESIADQLPVGFSSGSLSGLDLGAYYIKIERSVHSTGFDFQIINQQTTGGLFSTTTGQTVTIYWGDGTSNNYTGSSVAWTHTYATYSGVTYNCKMTNASALTRFTNTTGAGTGISFDIKDLPRAVTIFQVSANNIISGSSPDLPSGLTTFQLYGANTISGSVLYFATTITTLDYYHSNPTCELTGTMSGFPASLTFLAFNANTGITGSIATIGDACSYFSFIRNAARATYSTSAWPTTMNRVYYNTTTGNGLTSAEVDQWLIDLAAYCTTWTGSKSVWLAGYNAARTSASDAARATLIARGVTVTTN